MLSGVPANPIVADARDLGAVWVLCANPSGVSQCWPVLAHASFGFLQNTSNQTSQI